MAQSEENVMAVVNAAKTSDGTKTCSEGTTWAMERLRLGSARVELNGEDGASSSSERAHASSEYFSTRIEWMMESKDKFESALEAEIEASRVHWSEVAQAGSEGQGCAEANRKVFRSLQEQYGGPRDGFFWDWDRTAMELGEKIAEGGQGALYRVICVHPEAGHMKNRFVVKVFKLEGWSLEDLQKLWPPGMLWHIMNARSGKLWYGGVGTAELMRGVMLKDGSFGFMMVRYWGDLRKVIDVRMQRNGNQAAPFSIEISLFIMHQIAEGMRSLHEDGIVHRDLKASNVLIWPGTWNSFEVADGEFDVTSSDDFGVSIADFECSVGVVGTGFWRAPEILLGLKNGDLQPIVWSKQIDVYSFAMTCYEILTGKIPFEHLRATEYDVVIQGGRPTLPSSIDPWIQSLLEKCWHGDPSQRPSIVEIADVLGAFCDVHRCGCISMNGEIVI